MSVKMSARSVGKARSGSSTRNCAPKLRCALKSLHSAYGSVPRLPSPLPTISLFFFLLLGSYLLTTKTRSATQFKNFLHFPAGYAILSPCGHGGIGRRIRFRILRLRRAGSSPVARTKHDAEFHSFGAQRRFCARRSTPPASDIFLRIFGILRDY